MPYYTEIPDATIDLNATTPVLSLGQNLLLNQLYNSHSFDRYDVHDGAATTLTRGDEVELVLDNGTPEPGDDTTLLDNGLYAGSGTISTAAVSAGIPFLAELTVQVNPISGHYIIDQDDGKTYFVSDDPLDEDHIGVKITGTILGQTINLLNVNISDLASALPGGSEVLGLVQNLLDTVIVNLSYNPDGSLPLDEGDVVPCFTRGTMVATPHGLVAIETLKPGDLVLTRDHGAQPLRWIGSRRLDAVDLRHRPKLRPIRIRAGALAPSIPAEDLLVSPQHRMLVQSKIAQRMFGAPEVLAAAKQLLELDGVDIAEDVDSVEYFHILFDNHEVVTANGAESEALYLGPMALKAIGSVAAAEIMALFPELLEEDFVPVSARHLVPGRLARKLVARHIENGKPLYMN